MMLVCTPCNISSQDRNLFARTRYTWENLFVYSFFPHTQTLYTHTGANTLMQCPTLAGICLRGMRHRTRIVTAACVMLADLTTFKYRRRRCTTVIIRLLKHYMYVGYCRRVRQTAQHPNTCRVDNRTPSPSLSPQSSRS